MRGAAEPIVFDVVKGTRDLACPWCHRRHDGTCAEMLTEAMAATARRPEGRVRAMLLPAASLSPRARLLSATTLDRAQFRRPPTHAERARAPLAWAKMGTPA